MFDVEWVFVVVEDDGDGFLGVGGLFDCID